MRGIDKRAQSVPGDQRQHGRRDHPYASGLAGRGWHQDHVGEGDQGGGLAGRGVDEAVGGGVGALRGDDAELPSTLLSLTLGA